MENRNFWFAAIALVLIVGAILFQPTVEEQLAPKIENAWVAIEIDGTDRAEVGQFVLEEGTPFTLRAVAGARARDGSPVYYTPLGAPTDAKIQSIWTQLTNTETGPPASLEVQGRVLDVPQAALGAARFMFSDLCERPLGAADFLKVAHNFHTVFLERIPALAPQHRSLLRTLERAAQAQEQAGDA